MKTTTDDGAGFTPMDCSALSAGDVIQRGDLFQANDGRMLEMDNLGRLLGIRVLGVQIKKSGGWFRPLPNARHQRHLPAETTPENHNQYCSG